MKKKRALRTLITLALVGLALAWMYARGRQATTPLDRHTAAESDPTLASGDDVIPNELVVDFRDDEPHGEIDALGHQLGVTFEPASRQVDVDEIYTVKTDRPQALLTALRADPDVEAADLDYIYRLPEDALAPDLEALSAGDETDPAHKNFPNDPKYKYQWHLQQIHAKQAWKSAQGDGVIVAVIDTGVARVPDLAATELVPGYNFVSDSSNAADDHGHGTHVAGTIAQSTNNGIGVAGVAFHAKIMPIKVLSARGSGSVSGIAEGIRYAVDHGAKVINMSLGGAMNSSVLAKAVKYAHDKGVVVVCAAGNDGKGKVSYPAANPGAFAVAATQFDESTTFYSNWGKEIDIAAPGGNTRVDQNNDGMKDGVLQNTIVPGDIGRNDYLLFMGTSMASPHVAGVAALVMSQGVTDPDAVEAILQSTARAPHGDRSKIVSGPDNRYGAGIIDAQAAVQKAKQDFGGWELGIGLSALALMALGLKRRGLFGGFGVGGLLALIVGSSGLFFLPHLSIPGATLLEHGLPAWDLAFGASAHGNPLLYSALIPLALVLLLYHRKRLRGVLAGLAIGIGAHLLFHLFFHTVDLKLLPAALDSVWLGANALASFGLGWLLLRNIFPDFRSRPVALAAGRLLVYLPRLCRPGGDFPTYESGEEAR